MSVIPQPTHIKFDAKDPNKFLRDLQANKKDVIINTTANILVTGRPNSGVADFKDMLTEHFDASNIPYHVIVVKDANSATKAASAVNKEGRIVIIEDDYRLLFSTGVKLDQAKNLIYITRHWNLGAKEYSMFEQHIAFSSHRNEDLVGYPYPFSAIGAELSYGEYVLIDSHDISDVGKTVMK